MTAESRSPTVVLGFDGLDFRYLDQFSDVMPNISALRSEGVEAPLTTTFPPVTGSAWPSMFTGADPSHHGAYGFFHYDDHPETGRVVTRNDVQMPALWNYLTELDIPSVVLNMPVTYPAEPINGVLVPGYLSPESAVGHPAGIKEELSTELDEEYRIYGKTTLADHDTEILTEFEKLIELRSQAAEYLLSTNEWQLALIQIQKTDSVFHGFDDETAFRRIHRAADKVIGDLQEQIGEQTNLIICSDHGIGPADGYRIYINDILEKQDLLKRSAEDTALTIGNTKRELLETDHDTQAETSSLQSQVVDIIEDVFYAVGLSPGEIYSVANRYGLGPLLRTVVPESIIREVGGGVDWDRSQAYCRNRSELGVCINLEGRNRDGIVSNEEYERIREEIMARLSQLETPDGTPAFDFVKKREQLGSGNPPESASDIVFAPTEMAHSISTKVVGTKFRAEQSYNHQWDGVFIGHGPDFNTPELTSLSITDIAPIIMSLLRVGVPKRMTGEIPPDLLSVKETWEEYSGIDFGTGSETRSPDDEVVERLDELGYL